MIKEDFFKIDVRISSSCIKVTELKLSTLLFKNEKNYPWFILVPKKNNITEIFDLNFNEQQMLMEEINLVSSFIKKHFNCEKINFGALGNIVSQLHIHVVGRNSNDPLWPQGIWQENYRASIFEKSELDNIIKSFNILYN